MLGPNDLGGLSSEEKRLVAQLEKEVEDHFRTPRGQREPYTLEPHSVGAGEFTDRVKVELVKRANKAGWDASIDNDILTVRKK